MKERKYIATLDDGHDYLSIEFSSEHKAGSKANKDDCKQTMIKRWGYKEAQRWKIMNVTLRGY